MPASIQEFVDNAVEPHIRGFLHLPEASCGEALVLTHGAGGNAQAPLLRALAETFASAGYLVLRCNLPYRQARSFGPPGPTDATRDRAGLKNAVAAMKNLVREKENEKAKEETREKEVERRDKVKVEGREKETVEGKVEGKEKGGAPLLAGVARSGKASSQEQRIFLAGHSYGGRQASMLCAEEPGLVSGLLLLSYPLHPPRRPEQQRTQHLPDLRTPTLFVHGTRDPFASTEEIERALKMIPARTKLLEIDGAGHDLGFKGKSEKQELTGKIFSEFSNFLQLSS